MASYTPSMNLKLEGTYGCHPSIRSWGKLVRCLDKLWAMRDQHGLTQITYQVCIWWIVWHHVGTNSCQFDDISQMRQFSCKGIVLPFIIVIYLFLLFFLFILLFSLSSPFLLSPCHHFLSIQSASTVGPYLCLCSAPCAVDVLIEMLNLVTVKNTASGDVLPCDLVEIYQHFRGMC